MKAPHSFHIEVSKRIHVLQPLVIAADEIDSPEFSFFVLRLYCFLPVDYDIIILGPLVEITESFLEFLPSLR
jgi:hypothetical protein